MGGFKIKKLSDKAVERTQKIESLYQNKIMSIVQKIPLDSNFDEKVEFLYNSLVNELSYDYNALEHTNESGQVYPTFFDTLDDESVPAEYRNYASTSNPQSALLHGLALCSATSEIFKDLCDKAGIKCEICIGRTAVVDEKTGIRRGHRWNIVEDEQGKRSHVDVTYGRFVQDNHTFKNCEGRKIGDFCMISDSVLSQIGPHTITADVKPCNYTSVRRGNLEKLVGAEEMTPLQQREAKLTALEETAKKYSELEALQSKLTQKNDKDVRE